MRRIFQPSWFFGGVSLVLAIGCVAILTGCIGVPPEVEKDRTKIVISLDDMQGTWKVVTATDPEGNGFEADGVEVIIKDDLATSGESKLRIAFNADGSYLKLYASPPMGEEVIVGEVAVTQTLEQSPVQMLWTERGKPKQTTLLEKK